MIDTTNAPEERDDDKEPTPTTTNTPPVRQPFWTWDKVMPALIEGMGVDARAAVILSERYQRPCARSTVFRLRKEHPEADDAIVEAIRVRVSGIGDKMFKAAEQGNVHAMKWVLACFGKDMGWTTRHEVVGKNGGPVQVQQTVPDLYTPEFMATLSEDELNMLLLIEEKKEAVSARKALPSPGEPVGTSQHPGAGVGDEG